MQSDYRLIYISKAKEDLTYSELSKILVSARNFNSRFFITGLLIYRDDFFVQVLEGQEFHLKTLIGKIIADSRHSHLRIITEGPIEKRQFATWSMAFLDADLSPGTSDFIQKICSDQMLVTTPSDLEFEANFSEISQKLQEIEQRI